MLSAEERRLRKNARLRRWRQANLKHINKRARKWRMDNPDKVQEYIRRAEKKRTPEQLEQRSIANKIWKQNNPERVNEYSRKQYANRTEEQKVQQRIMRRKWAAANKLALRGYYLKRKYGLTLDQWVELFMQQNYRCALCKTIKPGKFKHWCTDHCHKTNKVRMILCNSCNQILGICKEDMNHLRRIVAGFEGRPL